MSKRSARGKKYFQFILLTIILIVVSVMMSKFVSLNQSIFSFDVIMNYCGIIFQISGIFLLFIIVESSVSGVGKKKYILRLQSGKLNINIGGASAKNNISNEDILEIKVQKLEEKLDENLKYLSEIDTKIEKLYEVIYSNDNHNRNWFIDFLHKGYTIEVKSLSLVLSGVVLSSFSGELAALSIFMMGILRDAG
ncbi:MAG: hypothetical protein JJU21_00695 [Salinarimonas sp.]|nr:hypothetical protein [Salinarimonas sp.]